MPARSCNCSGPCGPQDDSPEEGSEERDGVSRRGFITLAGGVAAAGLISLTARPGRAAEDKAQALADWKRALRLPDAPRRYVGGVHNDVRFPLGGIGTGNIELGADGQFLVWQLFNTLRDGYVPFFWGVRAGNTARLLQTAGGPPGWTAVQSCEMTGEYPIANLAFRDPELPVTVDLRAFTPFAPLDSAVSSWPIACFVFRVHNPTSTPQTVSLASFLQNPIGYDALGPVRKNAERLDNRHPNYGGNVNTVHSDAAVTVISFQAQPATIPTFRRPLRLYTNVNPAALNSLPFERPANMTVLPLESLKAASASAIEDILIWIEEAPLDLAESLLLPIRSAVENGATLIWSGTQASLLDVYANYARHQTNQTAPIPDTVFEDFENGYGNWQIEGTAFGSSPAKGTLPNQQVVSGFSGSSLVNSFAGGDDSTGRLTSPPFTIAQDYISFLVGGGSYPQTQVRLLVDSKVVRAQSGKNEERLSRAIWDVREWKGKTARIVIVDDRTGPWGHINADHFVFTNMPTSPSLLAALTGLVPTGEAEAHLQKGRVVRLQSGLLSGESVQLWAARQSAYATLCALADIPYTVSPGVPPRMPGAGTLALATAVPSARTLASFTDWQTAWQWFTGSGGEVASTSAPSPPGQTVNGALSASVTVAPGETAEIPFVLAWHYPHYYSDNDPIGNHYATRWPDAHSVAQDALKELSTLRARTERFRESFYESTLPYWLKDCITSQISTLRHAGVVFRSERGDLYGWEGSNGCCAPTCTHVWGYEQSVAYLFPDLERNMRNIDLFHQQKTDGGVNNRTVVPSPPHPTGEHPFADGQASTVLKAYREIRNSRDDTLLHRYWPRVRAAVEYLIAQDMASSADGKPDGTLSGNQWNTYDNAVHGVNSFIGSYYLAALRAGEEMAKRMNAERDAARFHNLFEQGQRRLIDLCWNGEYFQQHLPDYDKRAGEYGPGCLSDQLIGQWWAHQLDLGYLFPAALVRSALASVYRYNWLPDHTNFRHNWRKFAGGTDKGLLICTWPKGGRPAQTIPYVDEVWTGVEYQVASHMLYEGMTDEAFAIIKGARDRYDGIPRSPMPRNPWSEIECGGHYVRAMSSWSLLLALSGFSYDGPRGILQFAPRYPSEDFQCFFSAAEGWGSLKQMRQGNISTSEIRVEEGKVGVSELRLGMIGNTMPDRAQVTVNGKTIPVSLSADWEKRLLRLALGSPQFVVPGSPLTIAIGGRNLSS